MANFNIVSNNPLVADKYGELVRFIEGGVPEVFTAVRDAVHKGAVLISHPLAGSVKPNESPYKSVLASSRTGPLDDDSLKLIEASIDVLRKMPVKLRNYPPQVLDDFMVIDLDLVNSAMSALPADYHL